MTRKLNSGRPAAPGAAAPLAARFDPQGASLETTRDLIDGTLSAALDIVAWVEHAQRLNAHAISAWSQLLHEASKQLEQASDWQALMAVPATLASRQLSLAVEQFGSGLNQLLESDAQLVDRVRGDALQMSHRFLPAAWASTDPEAASTDTTLPAPPGQTPTEWLSLTQRWLDAFGPAARH